MKKSLLIILCSVLTFAGCFRVSNAIDERIENVYAGRASRPTIVIDAGHGGADAGAIGIDGALEKNINLSIALILYDYLAVSGIKCDLIRNGDYEIYKEGEGRARSDLYNRLDYINSVENAILISIHQNHYDNESEWGTQIWYSDNDETSQRLADKALGYINKNLQPDNSRSNKSAGDSYYLLSKASVPSIMIECGFISNVGECQRLQQQGYQKDLAYSIMLGVSEEI